MATIKPMDDVLRALYNAETRDEVDNAIRFGGDVNEIADTLGMSPFHVASAYGPPDVLQAMIAHGGDLEAPVPAGLTLAEDPAYPKADYYETPNDEDYNRMAGKRPLDLAIDHSEPDVTRELLNAGASVERGARETPVLHAALRKHGETAEENVKLLLDHGVNPNQPDTTLRSHKETPLHIAVDEQHSNGTMQALLDHGADVNAQDSRGRTPLVNAIHTDNADAADVLMANGADTTQALEDRSIPDRSWSRARKSMGTLKKVFEADGEQEPTVKWLLNEFGSKRLNHDEGVGPLSGDVLPDASTGSRKPSSDPDAPQREQMIDWVMHDEHEKVQAAFDRFELPTTNLLHYANSPSMVDRLVGLGADVNQTYHDFRERDQDHEEAWTDETTYTPLQMMVGRGEKESFDRLLDHGADFEIGGDKRPLMLALADFSSDPKDPVLAIANDLLDRGARVHPESYMEKPALLVAVENNRQEPIVRRLLEAGADPQQGFQNDGTPLHRVTDSQPGVLDLLVDYGAQVNAPSSEENPNLPIQSAMWRGQPRTAERLIERGADALSEVQSPGWHTFEALQRPKQREAVEVVRGVAIEREQAALRQVAADVTQAPEVAEAPAPRRRMRL